MRIASSMELLKVLIIFGKKTQNEWGNFARGKADKQRERLLKLFSHYFLLDQKNFIKQEIKPLRFYSFTKGIVGLTVTRIKCRGFEVVTWSEKMFI
jgi:hypothetical protein